MENLEHAKTMLATGRFTCVACRGEDVRTATDRGVRPLLTWLEAGYDLTGFSAADRVVGRATAFLYCLLGVTEVYARVMSRPAAQVLTQQGIAVSADVFADGIINRKGDGPCPFEAAVMEIDDPQEALHAIRNKLIKLTATCN